jgi:hypothetical protein
MHQEMDMILKWKVKGKSKTYCMKYYLKCPIILSFLYKLKIGILYIIFFDFIYMLINYVKYKFK